MINKKLGMLLVLLGTCVLSTSVVGMITMIYFFLKLFN